jgi:hypothetical protein
MSPGSLLSTGYIAGGTIGGVVVAFTEFLPSTWTGAMKIGERLHWVEYTWPAVVMFGALLIVLIFVSLRNPKEPGTAKAPPKRGFEVVTPQEE